MKAEDFAGRDIITMRDFSREELEFIFDSTKEIESGRPGGPLDGKLVALIFYEPSTRTYSSFEIAAERPGRRSTGFPQPQQCPIREVEALHATIRMYEGVRVVCNILSHYLIVDT